MSRLWLAIPLALASTSTAGAAPADVAAAIAGPGRPDAYVALDAVRRPVEVLRFLGLQQGARVLDYGAGGGYYTEIIAQAIGPEGMVVGWNPPAFAARPQVREAQARIRRRAPNASFFATPNSALSFPPRSFDFVLLHLTYHDSYWQDDGMAFGFSRIDPGIVTRALFEATLPGGIVGVIDHVARPGRDTRTEVEATHRIDPAVVRADFERAGFVFEGENSVLRVPEDDHTRRVFDPAIRGRTDRFVYRFRRPRG